MYFNEQLLYFIFKEYGEAGDIARPIQVSKGSKFSNKSSQIGDASTSNRKYSSTPSQRLKAGHKSRKSSLKAARCLVCCPCALVIKVITATTIPATFLILANCVICTLASCSPFWVYLGDAWHSGPIFTCNNKYTDYELNCTVTGGNLLNQEGMEKKVLNLHIILPYFISKLSSGLIFFFFNSPVFFVPIITSISY